MNSSKPWIAALFIVLVGLSACRHDKHSIDEAEILLQQGLEQRAATNTKAATESFSQALVLVNQCDGEKPETQRLKAKVEDNLGAMYWKHGLNNEALELHLDAIRLLRELDEPVLLMKALRNCGRVTASLQRLDEASTYYEEALQTAANDTSFVNGLRMEMAHDLYLQNGDYAQAIQMATAALDGGEEPYFCHLVLGLSNYYLDNDSLALVHLNEAAQSEKASVRMPAYQAMYRIYQHGGDYQQALRCHELYNENMQLSDREYKTQEVQRIKEDYDLQTQRLKLQAEQSIKNFQLYILIGLLLVALMVTLLLLRQKSLKERIMAEESKNQLESALKKNKVYVTALALAEQITVSTLDFDLKESDWNEFTALVDKVYGNFTQRLVAQYPALNKNDLEICCLTRQGFSNQVISILMNIQTGSYARRKSRIKQEKMNGLQDERSFEEILRQI